MTLKTKPFGRAALGVAGLCAVLAGAGNPIQVSGGIETPSSPHEKAATYAADSGGLEDALVSSHDYPPVKPAGSALRIEGTLEGRFMRQGTLTRTSLHEFIALMDGCRLYIRATPVASEQMERQHVPEQTDFQEYVYDGDASYTSRQ